MSKQRNPRRSPAEILAAKQAEMAALAIRAAKQSNHPAIGRINAALADLNGAIVQHQRGFSKGPQSFAARIESHSRWIDEITRARDFASTSLKDIQARKEELQRIRDEMAQDIANGVEPKFVDEVIADAFRPSPSVVSALDDLNIAVARRKNLQQENEAGA